MKHKIFLYGAIIASFSIYLIVYSESGTEGATRGLNLCYTAIIPSLFPFMVSSLMLYDSGFIAYLSRLFSKFAKKYFGLDDACFSVFILSLIGGYPVGAKLIDRLCCNKKIDEKIANAMLGFCVNSGPAFVVIAVGSIILKSELYGFILLVSNLIASLLILLFSTGVMKKHSYKTNRITADKKSISELIVSATKDSCESLLNICAFVVLFSTFIGILEEVIRTNGVTSFIISLFEVTNGVTICKNILTVSFLLGFSGFCVHFQVLSVCKSFKVNYPKFIAIRILHGLISSTITFAIIKLFGISVNTLSNTNEVYFSISQYSWYFGVAFILLSVLFMLTIRKNDKII